MLHTKTIEQMDADMEAPIYDADYYLSLQDSPLTDLEILEREIEQTEQNYL